MTYKARSNRNRNNVKLLFSLNDVDFIVFDTETTGLDPKVDYIVECLINDDELTEHLWSAIDHYLEEVK